MTPPIVILTDFGTLDPYVGIMKGVIMQINPLATFIDLSHQVPPGDIDRAAVDLWRATPHFPKGSIFLTIVDPGVGTQRKPVLIQTQDRFFVGPDNGVFSFILGTAPQAWELNNPEYMLPTPGKTFHGRDIFAPAAAHVSLGIPGRLFGDNIPHLVQLPKPTLQISQRQITGEILHVDHFGNLLTSLGVFHPTSDGKYELKPWTGEMGSTTIDLCHASLRLPNRETLSWAPTFGLIPKGQCGMMVGSSGLLEIVANRSNAAQRLNLKRGDKFTLALPKS